MVFTLHNGLMDRNRIAFEGIPVDRFPESCIVPMPITLEERIGTETGLFLVDKTPFIDRLRATSPFKLMLKTGLLNTSHGPVMFLLFYVPNPADDSEPLITLENYLDLFNPAAVQPWRDLSRQTHWHLMLVNGRGEEVGLVEFGNIYGLGEALDVSRKVCEPMRRGNFALAKAEACRDNTMEDLLNAE
jgi:hypothetical protein